MIDSPHKHLLSESNSRKSILKAIPNDIPKVNTLSPSKSTYISADQIYPDHCDDIDSPVDDRLNESFEERMDQRFSHSYSAGDDMKKGILRNRGMKGAISELDLNQTKLSSSPTKASKSFLQRFKSAFSRAFATSDKSLSKSVLSVNTVHNSRSLSQTDLRINCNPKASRLNIAQLGGGGARIDRSPSFVKNIRTRISLRRSHKVNSPEKREKMSRSYSHKSLSLDNSIKSKSLKQLNVDLDCGDRIWGELIKLNADSSQVIQIRRQKGQAFGFFVARGTVNNIKGVFVSRMKDEETQKCLTGVLEIGDEILAIDGESVKEANIMRVNQLIANKDTIRLTIIPYMNNKYL
ncbi:unnamed protein product [Oppiella nova]|uniref:PDZ domain-containing protein n=1 Tax=Oppiella nova TaxID=334625 RepID=A0A7R9MN54_9ACAR|nr:unnamed protein product [Oppiella nova]CAG2180073.1 unnamed protein product [Oppiella nova]